MALSQQQWFDKLKSFVPTWFFESEHYNEAIFQAIAKVLATKQLEAEGTVAETFITEAVGSFLDLHGSERSVIRSANEPDATYADRIRYIQNNNSKESLIPLIKAALNNGDPIIVENWAFGFADDALFADDVESVWISGRKQYNRFTVLIPNQEVSDDSQIRTLIIEIINENKALGVLYDVVYARTEYLSLETGDLLITEDDDNIIGEVE